MLCDRHGWDLVGWRVGTDQWWFVGSSHRWNSAWWEAKVKLLGEGGSEHAGLRGEVQLGLNRCRWVSSYWHVLAVKLHSSRVT